MTLMQLTSHLVVILTAAGLPVDCSAKMKADEFIRRRHLLVTSAKSRAWQATNATLVPRHCGGRRHDGSGE